MFRLLVFILFLLAAGVLLSQLADIPGELTLEWAGWRVETSPLVLLFAAILLVVLSFGAFKLISGLIRFPGDYSRNRRLANHDRGLSALTEAFAALAVSDLANARKLTRRADRLLGQPPVTRLLYAQLAKQEGKDEEAAAQLKPLLEHKETRFLAARGLLEQARKAGRIEQALAYAEEAESIRPDSSYATLSLIDLYTHESRWQQALAVIEKAQKHGALSREEVHRYSAIVHYQHALRLVERDDYDTAMAYARSATKLLPDMVPAANLLMQIHDKMADRRPIAGIAHRIWKHFPHPSTAALYKNIYLEESAAKRLKRVEKLASFNPENIESQIVIGEAALDAGEYSKARNHLKIALGKQETPRICRLMARLEETEHKSREAAEQWMERAVIADIGPSWTCETCNAIVEKWQLHCPECDSFDTIRWKINKLNFVEPKTRELPRI